MKKIQNKSVMRSIRFDQDTIDFLSQYGPFATVARIVIEKAIDNWPEFQKPQDSKIEPEIFDGTKEALDNLTIKGE